jgi:peroxiredoxin
MQPFLKIAMFVWVLPFTLLSYGQEESRTPDSPPAIVLRDARGAEHRFPDQNQEVKASVVIFLMTDCPVANAMVPDLRELASRYAPLGIRFYGIFSGEEPEDILRHSKDYRIAFPCLLDDSGVLAEKCGATRVPEAAIFDKNGRSVYRGRIDDRAVRIGRMKPVPAERNLADALAALVAGKPLPPPQPATAGCFIPKQSSQVTQQPKPQSNP